MQVRVSKTHIMNRTLMHGLYFPLLFYFSITVEDCDGGRVVSCDNPKSAMDCWTSSVRAVISFYVTHMLSDVIKKGFKVSLLVCFFFGPTFDQMSFATNTMSS